MELHVGDKVRTVNTDDDGRAQFDNLTPGATVKAGADVDGERLESQEFPAPPRGGIRLMLVATDKAKARRRRSRARPRSPGDVVLGGESRIIVEPGDERLGLLPARHREQRARAGEPAGAVRLRDAVRRVGATVLEGSSQQAPRRARRSSWTARFRRAHAPCRSAYRFRRRADRSTIAQRFPRDAEQLAVIVKKSATRRFVRRRSSEQQEMPARARCTSLRPAAASRRASRSA